MSKRDVGLRAYSPWRSSRVGGGRLGVGYPTGFEAPAPSSRRVASHLAHALECGVLEELPFRHWILHDVFPEETARALEALPGPPPFEGPSGARELHNADRRYFDADAIKTTPICSSVARAIQSARVRQAIENLTGARLSDCYLRIEYAQDLDGFWLEPHTDLGVKVFTLLYCLPENETQVDLGTDLYWDHERWAKRLPFERGAALVFLPSDCTWHGFAPRPIASIRRLLIVNYVTAAWRSREQLAFPQDPA